MQGHTSLRVRASFLISQSGAVQKRSVFRYSASVQVLLQSTENIHYNRLETDIFSPRAACVEESGRARARSSIHKVYKLLTSYYSGAREDGRGWPRRTASEREGGLYYRMCAMNAHAWNTAWGGCAIARQRRGKNRRVSLWFERNQTVSSSGSSARSPRRSLLRQVKVFRRFLHEHWGCSTERDELNEAVEWDDICSQSAGSADRAVMWQNTETDEREIKTMRHVLKSAVKTAHLSLKIRNVSRPSAEP